MSCEAAFTKMKQILTSLSAMVQSIKENELQLYLTMSDVTINATLSKETTNSN